jgi:hypothetical protein
MGLIFKTFYKVFMALAFGIYTVAAGWNSPLGGVARFFCFRKSTPVQLENGKVKPISNIRVGDKLQNGGKVISFMRFSGDEVPVYAYPTETDTVFVAGSHLVLENMKWIRVDESPKAQYVNEEELDLYCLLTESGRIGIDGVTFADYMEIDHQEDLQWVRDHISIALNIDRVVKPSRKRADKAWGIDGRRMVRMAQLDDDDCTHWKHVDELRIGDELAEGGYVEGIVEISADHVDVFSYQDVICSGDMFVYDSEFGTWEVIREKTGAVPVQSPKRLYNICTTEGVFRVGKLLWRDFEQEKSEGVNQEIDCYVELKLNKGR